MTDRPASSDQTALYEDVLATLRLAILTARQLHHPEHAPAEWLAALIASLEGLGWDAEAHDYAEYVYTPEPGVWTDIFNGRKPAPQPPNTRFKTLVRHVIENRSDGSKPLPRSVADGNLSAHFVSEVNMATPVPRLRLVQLAGTPDPKAPKTRLPVARTCWEAAFDSQRFDKQREKVSAAFSDLEQSILGPDEP